MLEDRLLATLPEGATTQDILFDGVGQQVAYVLKQSDDKKVVVLGDQRSPPFDSLFTREWSRDGRHFAYLAEAQGKYFVVVDGATSGPYARCTPYLRWSPDGRIGYNADGLLFTGTQSFAPLGPVMDFHWRPDNTLTYAFKQGREKQALVVDGKVGETFYYMLEPAWSADGAHLAYAASTGKAMFLVVDGKKTEHAQADNLAWSPDGKQLAYTSRLPSAHQDPYTYVVQRGAEQSEPFEEVSAPVWSPDSRQLAYVAKKDGQRQIRGDKTSAAHDEVSAPVWSPDSKHIAFVVKDGTQQRVVVDDEAGEAFERARAGTLSWSPDSTQLAYVAQKDGKAYVVVGDKKSAAVDAAARLRWSKDGASVGFGAVVGNELRWRVMAVR
ncbi:MAG: PD40 domain-containing protein [Myxococcales bacterium]|nr:PD40 domain-containing protein [Myxococcales bacterium]